MALAISSNTQQLVKLKSVHCYLVLYNFLFRNKDIFVVKDNFRKLNDLYFEIKRVLGKVTCFSLEFVRPQMYM